MTAVFRFYSLAFHLGFIYKSFHRDEYPVLEISREAVPWCFSAALSLLPFSSVALTGNKTLYLCNSDLHVTVLNTDLFLLVSSEACVWLHVCSVWLSRVRFSASPWTVARQAPLSMGFSRQEYCSGLPFSSPRDLPNPRIKSTSLMSSALTGGFFCISFT